MCWQTRGAAQAGREGGELEVKDGKWKSTTGQHRSLPASLGTRKWGANLGRSKAMLLGIRQVCTGSPRPQALTSFPWEHPVRGGKQTLLYLCICKSYKLRL